MAQQETDAFFIGWSGRTGPALGRFLTVVALVCLGGLGAIGFALSRWADDPAESLLRLGERDAAGAAVTPQDWGGEELFRGRLTRAGYPLLQLPPTPEAPAGRVLLLTGDGKRGADVAAEGPVELRGSVLRRGALEMLVVDGAGKTLADEAGLPAATRRSLGRWRIAGEICDGKCYAGAMRPGHGLAHKACANLCLIGDVPAVLVTAEPVAGSSFLVLAGPDGGPPPASIRDWTAIPVEVQGEVERIGNVLVLRLDPARTRRL